MRVTQAKYTKFLYPVLLCFILLPLLESNLNFVDVKRLNGAVVGKDTIPVFSFKKWFSGSFQSQEEKFVNDSFGFRNICVRINNQVDYSLFNRSHSSDIEIGKNGYLYGTLSMDCIYGNDFLGTASISRSVSKLKFINDTLAKLGKIFVLIIAPHKGLVCPEELAEYPYPFRDTTNYEVYLKLLKQAQIHVVDFNSYFKTRINKTKYPIECKTGVHWSSYGAALAGDSIIRYLESVLHIKMPKPVWGDMNLSKAKMHDIDAEQTLNLLFDIPSPLMAYPTIKYENGPDAIKPRAMIVGDSFYDELAENGIGNVFDKSSNYWYYFTNYGMKLSRNQVKDEIGQSNVVILLTAQYNLARIGWGFVDTTYCMFKNINSVHSQEESRAEKLEDVKEDIKLNVNWLRQIEAGAYEKGVSLDSAIKGNASWIINNQAKN
jgi:hypothetical protein